MKILGNYNGLGAVSWWYGHDPNADATDRDRSHRRASAWNRFVLHLGARWRLVRCAAALRRAAASARRFRSGCCCDAPGLARADRARARRASGYSARASGRRSGWVHRSRSDRRYRRCGSRGRGRHAAAAHRGRGTKAARRGSSHFRHRGRQRSGLISSKMLGGASQIVSKIRVKCNSKQKNTHRDRCTKTDGATTARRSRFVARHTRMTRRGGATTSGYCRRP